MGASFTCDYCGKTLKAEYDDYEGWGAVEGSTYKYRCKPLHFYVVMCANQKYTEVGDRKIENDGCWFLFRRRENIELFHPEHGGEPYWRKLVKD